MAEESEKKFHAIMDKLFNGSSKSTSKSTTATPTAQSTSSPAQLSRGIKRPNAEMTLSVFEPKGNAGGLKHPLVSGGSVQTPLCRPWDRGDLTRRLATFKSMTWFAKPQAVSAVNCARRGWINVEMDTIACEACGSRLFFSTPSTWSQGQVEKAASVFSLKLDNGHKLLCPWINNACDERLALFPPTPAAGLVEEYKKRHSALLQLLALPVISSSAIDYMTSPQLEHFLRGSSAVGHSNLSADSSQTEILGHESGADSSLLYYQAQKLISLCGWEPRSLPYIVHCKGLQSQPMDDSNLSDISRGISSGRVPSTVTCASGIDGTMRSNDDTVNSSMLQSDPNSVVLDCRLCGASVGLWTFSTVPRPLELLRLVGCTEITDGHDSAHDKEDNIHGEVGASGTQDLSIVNHVGNKEGTVTGASCSTSSGERLLNLGLTIAGGPPPTKQNFRATISLPVIGRNLRALISSSSDFRYHLCVNNSFQGGQNQKESTLHDRGFQPEDVDGKQVNNEHCNITSNDESTYPNNDIDVQGDALRNEQNCEISSEGTKSVGLGFPETAAADSVTQNPIQGTPGSEDGFRKNEKFPENVESISTDNLTVVVSGSSQARDSSVEPSVGHVTIRNEKTVENETSVCVTRVDGQDGSGVKTRMQPVDNNIVLWSTGKNLDQLQLDNAMGFDPIRQHRHFCPWIASTGNSPPGWLKTLYALERQEEFSCPFSTEVPSSSLIEVDDPIASIRKLFRSPSAKRMKITHRSS